MRRNLPERFLDRVLDAARKCGFWRFMLLAVLASEAFTLIMNTINSYLWWGELSVDLLLIGVIDALIVSTIIAGFIALLLFRLRDTGIELSEQKNKLEAVLANIGEGVTIVDRNYNVQYQNQAHKDQVGPNPGKTCYASILGRKEPCEPCPVRNCLSDGQVCKMETSLESGSGTRYFDITASPLPDGLGGVSACIEIVRETTEHKRSEQAVAESEMKFRSLVETAGDAIFVADADTGVIFDANKKASELIGRPLEQIIGMHQCELHPVEDRDSMAQAFREDVRKAQTVRKGVCVSHKDGRRVPVEITCTVTEFGGRKIVQGIFRDVSERMEMEKEREELLAMLRHDMNTPLAVIAGNAQSIIMLEDSRLSDDAKGMLWSIENNTRRLSSMIEDHSVMSTLESGWISLSLDEVDARELLLESSIWAGDLARSKCLRFERDVPEGIPNIKANKSYMQRAIANLLQNAINYTQSGGLVRLSAKEVSNGSGKGVVISVADNGPGIDEADKGRIFDKYFRSTRVKNTSGSGLGLAIVKAVAVAHGGSVELESEVGNGSTFNIFLPVKS